MIRFPFFAAYLDVAGSLVFLACSSVLAVTFAFEQAIKT